MNRALGLVALCSLFGLVDCGGGGDGAGNASCRGILIRYTECGVFAGGTQVCHAQPERQVDECLAACIEDASCNDIEDYACSGTPNGCIAECLSERFTCDNGQRIQSALQCNSFADCSDNSDEEHCEIPIFRCGDFNATSIDINGERVCDGDFDCPQGNDEDECGDFVCGIGSSDATTSEALPDVVTPPYSNPASAPE